MALTQPIPRTTQKIFGNSLATTNNVAVWGSLAAGSPAYTGSLATIQSLSQFEQGLNGAVVGNRSPAIQDLNGLFYLLTGQIAYLLQNGIAEWDSGTTYYQTQICRIGTVLYTSLTNANVGNNPATDTNNWSPYFAKATGPTLARAWVEFDGINDSSPGSSRIINSFNVSSITHNGTGDYTINFANALPSANYVFSGSCGVEDGQSPSNGPADQGIVVGAKYPNLGVRNANTCRVYTIDPTSRANVQSGCVSVLFFGS
jgi:hypothetical protein